MSRKLIVTLTNNQSLIVEMKPGTENISDEDVFKELIQHSKSFTMIGTTAVALHHIVSVEILKKEEANE